MMRRRGLYSGLLCRPAPAAPITALVAALAIAAPRHAGAQDTGTLRVNLGPGGERGSFLVTCMRDGEVVFQTESTWGSGPSCMIAGSTDLPVGVYDVRVEGAGVRTEVRRGLRVTADNPTALYVVMEAGQGARVVEYGTGGLAREEVAARLRALEADRTRLLERLEVLEGRVEELHGRGNG